jgi:hypothetical protein
MILFLFAHTGVESPPNSPTVAVWNPLGRFVPDVPQRYRSIFVTNEVSTHLTMANVHRQFVLFYYTVHNNKVRSKITVTTICPFVKHIEGLKVVRESRPSTWDIVAITHKRELASVTISVLEHLCGN